MAPESRASRSPGRTVLLAALVAMGLVSLIVVGATLMFPRPPQEEGPSMPAAAASPQVEPSQPPRTQPDPEPRSRRVAIPRPPARSAAASPEDEPQGEDTDDDGLDSDFPRVQADRREIAELMNKALAPQMPAMVECLTDWRLEQPDVFSGRVAFAFTFDRDGIVDMAIDDVDQVPENVLSCLGDVLWEEVDWPGVDTEAPLAVTWPIEVSIDPSDEE